MKLALKITGGVLGVAVVAGFATTMVIVNKKDEEDVKSPNTNNENPTGWTPGFNAALNSGTYNGPLSVRADGVDNTKLRIANWNLANFRGSYNRAHSMAQIINYAKISLLGAEEIDKIEGLYTIAKILNNLQHRDTEKAKGWKVVSSTIAEYSHDASGNKLTKKMGGLGAGEYYGFIYDADLFTPKQFKETGKIGKIYPNGFVHNELFDNYKGLPSGINTDSAYVRPPYGVQFEHNTTHKDFTAVIAHLDSPGTHAKSSDPAHSKNHSKTETTYEGTTSLSDWKDKYMPGMGTQELFEARHVKEVMTYFNKINGADNDMIFMGDTNIPYYNGYSDNHIAESPFKPLIDQGYSGLLDPSLSSSATSLSKTASTISDERKRGRLYVNPYDKIFTNNLSFIDGTKGKVGHRFKIEKSFDSDGANVNAAKLHADIHHPGSVTKISDHTMVYATYNFKSGKEKGRSKTIASDQPARNIDVNSASFFELNTLAGVPAPAVYKILYYRNIVGKINSADEMSRLTSYYDDFKSKTAGYASWYERNSNVKFVFNGSVTKKATESIRIENSRHMSKITEISMAAINVNTSSLKELTNATKKGLLSKELLASILTKRSSTTTMNSYSDIRNPKNPNPLVSFYSGVLDYTGTATHLNNPLDLNLATFDEMKKYLVGYNSPFGLSEYHISSIVAQRQRVGKLDYSTLLSAIGKYGMGKLPKWSLNFDSIPVHNQEADLMTKININEASRKQIVRYLGIKYGTQVFETIQDHAKANPLSSNSNKGTGLNTWDKILGNIRDARYFKYQLLNVFKIDALNIDVDIEHVGATYTYAQMQTEADKVAFLKNSHDASGHKTKSSVVYASPQFDSWVKWLKDNTGIADVDPNKYVVGSLSRGAILNLALKVSQYSIWNIAYDAMTSYYHKSIYRKTFDVIRPIGSHRIPANGAKYSDSSGSLNGPTKVTNGGTVVAATTGTGTPTTGTHTSGSHHAQPTYTTAQNPFTFEELRLEAAKLLIYNKEYSASDFKDYNDELKAFAQYLMQHGGKQPTAMTKMLGRMRNTGVKHIIIAINNADNKAELLAAFKDSRIMSATYVYSKYKTDFDAFLNLLSDDALTIAKVNAESLIEGLVCVEDDTQHISTLFDDVTDAKAAALKDIKEATTVAQVTAFASTSTTGSSILIVKNAIKAYTDSTISGTVTHTTGTGTATVIQVTPYVFSGLEDFINKEITFGDTNSYNHYSSNVSNADIDKFAKYLISHGAIVGTDASHPIGTMTRTALRRFLWAIFNSYGKEQLLENLKDASIMNTPRNQYGYSAFQSEYDSILRMLTNGPLTQARYDAYKALIGMRIPKDATKDPSLFGEIETAIDNAVNELYGNSDTKASIESISKPSATPDGKPTGTAIVAVQLAIDKYLASTAPPAGTTGVSFADVKAEALKASTLTSYHRAKDFDKEKLKAFADFLIGKGALTRDRPYHFIGALTPSPFAKFIVAINKANDKSALEADKLGQGSAYNKFKAAWDSILSIIT